MTDSQFSGRDPDSAPKGSKGQATRQRILQAGATLFSRTSFSSVPVRRIAAEAGVDASLINRYFGSKEGLFREILASALPKDLLSSALGEAPRERLGETLVRAADELWSSTKGAGLIAIARRSLAGDSATVRDALLSTIVAQIRSLIDDSGSTDPDLRASLVATQMLGLVVSRHLLKLEPVASLEREELARLIGPTIQRYLTGDLTGEATPG